MYEMGVGALSVGRGTVTPVSSPVSATGTASVRLRLKPTNVQAAVFPRAAGARRFAFNWALAQVRQTRTSGPLRPPTTSPRATGPDRSRTSTWSAAGTRPVTPTP